MNKLSLLTLIVPQDRSHAWQGFLRDQQLRTLFSFPCRGSAGDQILAALGLEVSEKTLFLGVTPTRRVRRILHHATTDMGISLPGSGIALSLPMTSVSGQSALAALLGGQPFDLNEVNNMPQHSDCSLLVAICEGGHADTVMEAALSGGARGGTIIHAKGTAGEENRFFMDIALASEKEMILIICREEARTAIMRAVMDKAGIDSPAHTILFSLPVEAVAGLRSVMKEDDEEAEEGEKGEKTAPDARD